MTEWIRLFALDGGQWAWVVLAAFLVGFSKTGISGFTMLVIPILATVFGGRDSTGVLLPMLIAGDVFAVLYYRRHATWKDIARLLPWALVGIMAGLAVGSLIDDRTFKLLIALIVLCCLALLVRSELRGEGETRLTRQSWFPPVTGVASGFATMIGNAAGPIFSLYLLAKGARKNNYMGTFAWFFLIINVTKLPLQTFVWHNITWRTMALALLMLPAITAGALLGAAVVRRLPEKPFRWVILVVTAVAAVRLFF